MPIEMLSQSDQPNLAIEKDNLNLKEGDDSWHRYAFNIDLKGDEEILKRLMDVLERRDKEENETCQKLCRNFEKIHANEKEVINYPCSFFYGLYSAELLEPGGIRLVICHQNAQTAGTYVTRALLEAKIMNTLFISGDDEYVASCTFKMKYESGRSVMEIKHLYENEKAYLAAMAKREEEFLDSRPDL